MVNHKEILRLKNLGLTNREIADAAVWPAQSTCMVSPGLCSRCMVALVFWT